MRATSPSGKSLDPIGKLLIKFGEVLLAIQAVFLYNPYMDRERSIRILIVEDHPLMRIGISRAIETDKSLAICGEADSLDSALELVERLKPDFIIADLSLKDGDGIRLIELIKQKQLSIPVLVVSMHDEPVYIERAFKAGAKGYILKRESSHEVVKAIHQILHGKVYSSESVSAKIIEHISRNQPASAIDPKAVLSKREYEVFILLGQGLSRPEIAERLHLSVKTVESHIEHIKPKLNITTGVQLVHLAFKHALR